MTFVSHLGSGVRCGVAAGVLGTACFYGLSRQEYNENNVSILYNDTLLVASELCLIKGPILGAGVGGGIYGKNRVVNFVKTKVPHSVQRKAFIVVCVVVATSLLAKTALNSGNNQNRS